MTKRDDWPGTPFDPADAAGYGRWRARKLAAAPPSAEALLVELATPEALRPAERERLLTLLRHSNMAIYAVAPTASPKAVVRALGAAFGLHRLDAHLCADEDAITPLSVQSAGDRKRYIPYTNRAIQWHTDGYYNTPEDSIRGMILHCGAQAESGGESQVMDHEMAYLWLRDRDPALVAALMRPDAMRIPANTAAPAAAGGEAAVLRPERRTPVFTVDSAGGGLHMRYTMRARNIAWAPEAEPARLALEAMLQSDSPHIFSHRLEAGQGLLCNNVLHNRAGFTNGPGGDRVMYRARYLDRIAGTTLAHFFGSA